jgi:uncharacterized protein YuzE
MDKRLVNIQIGHLTFDQATYDERGDVLYLHIGDRQAASDGEVTPEGHALRFDADGKLVGVTIVNAKRLLAVDGKLTITLPERFEVAPEAIAPALAPAA